MNNYQKAIENSNIVSKTDINGIITFVNDEFCNLFGFKKIKTSSFITFDEELEALFSLKPQLDSFFEKVFVNHEDEKIKTNRKNLIAQVYLGFRNIADIKEITI